MDIDKVVGITIGGLMLAFMFPIALTQLMDVNTTGWDGAVAGLWSVLPILLIVAGVVLVMAGYKRR